MSGQRRLVPVIWAMMPHHYALTHNGPTLNNDTLPHDYRTCAVMIMTVLGAGADSYGNLRAGLLGPKDAGGYQSDTADNAFKVHGFDVFWLEIPVQSKKGTNVPGPHRSHISLSLRQASLPCRRGPCTRHDRLVYSFALPDPPPTVPYS